jgi:LPLT family lysophospholipid transporter-like MFS transporter
VAAGLFLIPLNAGLQAESDPASLGKTIAVQNLSDNLGMCLAGGYVFLAARAGLSPGAVFLGLAGAVLLSMVFLRFRRAPVAAAAPSDTR